jgi:transposase
MRGGEGAQDVDTDQGLEFFAQLPPCLVGMEACGAAHYWGRELVKLGHTVKLMAAQFVTPYGKREFGLIVPQGVAHLRKQLPQILEDAENGLSALTRQRLAGLLEQFRELDQHIARYDRQMRELAQQSDASRRLLRVESIGPMTATAIVASMGDPHVFSRMRFPMGCGSAPRRRTCGRLHRRWCY